MPERIDWPIPTKPARPRRRILLFLLAGLAVVLFGSRTFLSNWVDLLWFQSLGYAAVFWKERGLQWGVFAAFTAATFLILYGVFSLLKRAHSVDLPDNHTIMIAGNPVILPVGPVLRVLALLISLIVALGTGAAMQAQWWTLALFWYAPNPAAGSPGAFPDPIFGLPLNFYLFTLPAFQLITGWLLTMAVLSCILAGIFILITGGSRALAGGFRSGILLPWRGI